jgi:hypothetical protein
VFGEDQSELRDSQTEALMCKKEKENEVDRDIFFTFSGLKVRSGR